MPLVNDMRFQFDVGPHGHAVIAGRAQEAAPPGWVPVVVADNDNVEHDISLYFNLNDNLN